GEDAAVEAEDERRHAVGEPHDQNAQRPARDERRPHQRDVLERIADLARAHREIDAPEARPPQQRERAGGGRREGMWQRLLRRCSYGICHRNVPFLKWPASKISSTNSSAPTATRRSG